MPFETLMIMESALVPDGRQVLTRAGRVVYVGATGDPIEDAEFDGMILSPADFAKLKDASSATNRR